MSLAGLRSDAEVLVVGLGLSGMAACRALVAAGARVRAVDTAEGGELAERAAALGELGVPVELGVSAEALADAVAGGASAPQLLVPSPGVRRTSPVLRAAAERGLEVWSEPELAWRLAAGRTRLVAVTGTNGKTSTCELLAACLQAPAAGNIGRPLTELLTAPAPPPLVVAELSSFQLRYADTLRAEVGILLNVAPDHLDWHGDLDDYHAAKARIWANQRAEETAVVARDDPGAQAVAARWPPPGRRTAFTVGAPEPGEAGVADGWLVWRPWHGPAVRVAALEQLQARGPHDLANAAATVAAAAALEADLGALAAPLSAYRPGRHRLECVARVGGVGYVDDSKATNPHAAAAALRAFPSVVWIGGGLDKGLDFAPLVAPLAERARAVVTVGAAAEQLAEVARRAGVPAVAAGTVARAVGEASRLAHPGDTVLLAPACASMDQFPDYRARGAAFQEAVRALAEEAGDGG